MTKKTRAQAHNILKENPSLKKVWVNRRGEIFTSEDWARDSDPTGKIEYVEDLTIKSKPEPKKS